MKATVEPLEGNKVKVSVEVDEVEFDQAMDAAFRRLAREVRIPGFRPGKAPRRILEARFGADVARQEALREALPSYYARAVREHEIDVIAPPEIDLRGGEDQGPLAFDAVVEVRPQISVAGYGGLRVVVPSPLADEAAVDEQVERLRGQHAALVDVERPAGGDDVVRVDLHGSRDGEPVEGLTATDFSYQVGSEMVPGLDDQLRGAKVGDVLTYQPELPGQDGPVDLRVLVKGVQERTLPEATDEWVSEVSEFETLDELRDDLRTRIANVRRFQSAMAVREKALEALTELVEVELPQALVDEELSTRLQDLSMRLSAQGVELQQWMAATGRSPQQLEQELRESAAANVKADLALRALADAEAIEVDDDELDAEIDRLAQGTKQSAKVLRRSLEQHDRMPSLRADLRKRKAAQWLVDHVEIADEDGRPVDRADLEPPAPAEDRAEEAS